MPWCIRVVTKLIKVLSLPPPVPVLAKNTTHPANQPALDPKSTGLIKEVSHLRRHVAEPGGRAKDDGFVIAQFIRGGDGRSLVKFYAVLLGHVERHRFGHAREGHFDTRNRACALGDGFGHRFDVAISGVVENKEFGHVFVWVVCLPLLG